MPDQGYVWSPYDASNPGFDPYGNGNWIWSPSFGYTWASAYSWGYLPYQCGAWNYYGGFGWGWAPGMGGCSPWWGLGYTGAQDGFAPGWYRPIYRPIGPGGPIRSGRAFPVIAVNRHPQVLNGGLPARNANVPVSINGRTVTALRPRRHRHIERPSFGIRSAYAVPGASGFAATARSGYVPARPAYARPAPGASGFNVDQADEHQRTYTPAPQHTYACTTERTYTPAQHNSAPSTHSQRLRPAITPVEAEAEGVVEAAVEAMQAAAEVAAAIARVPPIGSPPISRYRRPRPQFSTADLPVVCSVRASRPSIFLLLLYPQALPTAKPSRRTSASPPACDNADGQSRRDHELCLPAAPGLSQASGPHRLGAWLVSHACGAARVSPAPRAQPRSEARCPLRSMPKNHIKFAVCGMSHDHIYGMIGAVQRGGGELVAAWGGEARQDRHLQEALSQRQRSSPRRTRSSTTRPCNWCSARRLPTSAHRWAYAP